MSEYLIERCNDADMTAVDLRWHVTNEDGPFEAYRIVRLNDAGYRETVHGSMLWFPEAGRAGIEFGADSDWTDADSPEHALELWAAGELRN